MQNREERDCRVGVVVFEQCVEQDWNGHRIRRERDGDINPCERKPERGCELLWKVAVDQRCCLHERGDNRGDNDDCVGVECGIN